MLPHPDTACQLAMIDHNQRLREAARFRLADQAAQGRTPGVSLVAQLQDSLGLVLIRAGQRLQGIPPVSGLTAAEGGVAR